MVYEMNKPGSATTLKGFDFPGIIGKARAEEAKPRSKAEIVALLKSEGDRAATWLESLKPEFSAERGVYPDYRTVLEVAPEGNAARASRNTRCIIADS